jgi:hypothetical protein
MLGLRSEKVGAVWGCECRLANLVFDQLSRKQFGQCSLNPQVAKLAAGTTALTPSPKSCRQSTDKILETPTSDQPSETRRSPLPLSAFRRDGASWAAQPNTWPASALQQSGSPRDMHAGTSSYQLVGIRSPGASPRRAELQALEANRLTDTAANALGQNSPSSHEKWENATHLCTSTPDDVENSEAGICPSMLHTNRVLFPSDPAGGFVASDTANPQQERASVAEEQGDDSVRGPSETNGVFNAGRSTPLQGMLYFCQRVCEQTCCDSTNDHFGDI